MHSSAGRALVGFKPAADWLAAHRNQPVAANAADSAAGLSPSELRQAFEKFMDAYASSSGRVVAAKDKETLFAKFRESLAQSRGEQASAR